MSDTSAPPPPMELTKTGLFCCNKCFPLGSGKAKTSWACADFAAYNTRQGHHPPPILPQPLYIQPRLVNYLISYEVLKNSEPTGELRYFMRQVDMRHWYEIPEEVYKYEHNLFPFTDEGEYLKFVCEYHMGYTFLVRRLRHASEVKFWPETVAVERTRTARENDVGQWGDGGYVSAEFGDVRERVPRGGVVAETDDRQLNLD